MFGTRSGWDDEGVLPPDSWGRSTSRPPWEPSESGPPSPAPPGRSTSRLPWGFALVVVLLVVGRLTLTPHLTSPALRTWATVFVAVCVQALPFLVFGVALSAAITAFVPASFWTRALPRRPAVAVP
ncbi:hypothetical protein ACFQ08_44160, partial [Streptosporangium algeriense]